MVNTIWSYATSRKFLAHAIMIAFALASLNNIRNVVYQLKGDLFSAWAAGIALGLALVVMAAILSETRWMPGERRFTTILGVTVALTILSGLVQGYGFASKVGWVGYLFGLMFPALGELGIALAVSAYEEILSQRGIEDAQKSLESGVRDAIGESMRNVDRSKIERQVTQAANQMTAEIIELTVHNMMIDLRSQRRTDSGLHLPSVDDVVNINGTSKMSGLVQSDNPSMFGSHNLPVANDARSTIAQQRRQAILDILSDKGSMGVSDILDRLPDNMAASRSTLSDDLKQLAADGQVPPAEPVA